MAVLANKRGNSCNSVAPPSGMGLTADMEWACLLMLNERACLLMLNQRAHLMILNERACLPQP